jgi:hypothetical protein
MAALVTLEVAKAQLRPSSDYEDEDIERKIDQASGIILDYLKGRANKPATVVSSSVASPTVITTTAAHGYITGETAAIAGHVGSTPDLNGAFVVTVLSSTTYSIPVAVTGAGTGGTSIVEWSDETAPEPVRTAVLLMVAHLYENRGDDMKADDALWACIERLLMRSRDPAFA